MKLPRPGAGREFKYKVTRRNPITVLYGPIVSVKVPIAYEMLSHAAKNRLRQIVGRDSRVIRAYLGVIEQHEKELITGKNSTRIDQGHLNELTLTTQQVAGNTVPRSKVQHDFKRRFPRISTTELVECRQTAVWMYESYLSLLTKKGLNPSRPLRANKGRRIPRWIFIPYRAKVIGLDPVHRRLRLVIRDSMDSVPAGRRMHGSLNIPLNASAFHRSQLSRGAVKAAQIFKDVLGKWWVTFAVKVKLDDRYNPEELPVAVLGIDLGIRRAACATLITPEKVSETRYFMQLDKEQSLERYEQTISRLQRSVALARSRNAHSDGFFFKLKKLRRKRRRVSKEYDRLLVSNLLSYIEELGSRYSLYIALGCVQGIRNIARRGNGKGTSFRRMIHRWSFSRISKMLSHGLAQRGWKVSGKDKRLFYIHEAWTSITCWKCGRRGLRPRQSLFVCSCGFRTNADRNGSLNIARRLIRLIPSLRDENRLGRWATPERAPAPKAGMKTPSSERKPVLPEVVVVSGQGKSAAAYLVQSELCHDKTPIGQGNNDPAVARTVGILSVSGNDTPRDVQEEEARSGREVVP